MDQLLVALDVDSADEAIELSNQLRDVVGGFKIGSRLFTAEGPAVVHKMVKRGDKIFLDLKYHDIPSTVAGAVHAARNLGVWMLTVHASGGADMLRAAKEAAGEIECGPRIIAVTVLTSLNNLALSQLGITNSITEQVDYWTQLARDAGTDGVVVSPWEIERTRAKFGAKFTIVTPGIRDQATQILKDDQNRTRSATEAVKAGANYLVVGRPIVAASNPRAAAIQLCKKIAKVSQG